MKKDKAPKVIQVSDAEIKQLKSDIEKTNLSESQKKIVLTIIEGYYWLAQMYRMKKLSMNKLRRLFSFKTEKEEPKKSDDTKKDDEDNDQSPPSQDTKKTTPKKNGHGKNGKDKFKGAKKVFHKLDELITGDKCPDCLIGKLYPVTPGSHLHFTGHTPIQVTIHETEKLRCNACGKYFEAKLPEELKKKYHPSADVVLAIQKYALGTPFYRNGKWQEDMNVPISASTQWERCVSLFDSVYPAYESLLEYAAEGKLYFGDDTRNKILDLQKELRENKETRTGIYTTGVISKVGKRMIRLFFTGRNYCGENLDFLLERRKSESKAILMSDALSMNKPKKVDMDWANCMIHSRRNFWDYRDKYPGMVGFITREIGKIYKYDKKAEKLGLDEIERLKYHQKYSEPVLIGLRKWGLKKLYLKKIEPNEELGEAFKYFFKHYHELTLFLRKPGVPLDNNPLERILKTPILNRKNSYFFKTQLGALVGDVMMSLIETCKSLKVNPFKYLLTLHENKELVKKSSKDWLPWCYLENMTI